MTVKKNTVKEAKQYQKVPVGQGAQRLDNRAVKFSPLDGQIKV